MIIYVLYKYPQWLNQNVVRSGMYLKWVSLRDNAGPRAGFHGSSQLDYVSIIEMVTICKEEI